MSGISISTNATWNATYWGTVLGLFAAFLTAFYSWRLIIMTFHGTPRADHEVMHHVHESPQVMLWPLVVLALGACLGTVDSVCSLCRRRQCWRLTVSFGGE